MLREALTLIPYALLAALSPIGFAATLAVIGSGRLKALSFGIGFVAGQLGSLALLVLLGGDWKPSYQSSYPTMEALLQLGVGVALLWLAVFLYRRPLHPRQNVSSGRSKAMLERLSRLRVSTALIAGLLLGVGGPKRLVLTALAAASITGVNINTSQDAALVVWYVALASSLVWAPVLAFVFFGQHALTELAKGQRWLRDHQKQATVYPVALIGGILVAIGLIGLR